MLPIKSFKFILSFQFYYLFYEQKNVDIEGIRLRVEMTSPSVTLIRLLREITRLGKALDKVIYLKQLFSGLLSFG